MGEIGKQSHVLLCVLCRRIAALVHPGCGNAEGSVGKSEEDFRREYNGQEAAATARAEKPTTAGPVSGQLHHEDQRDLRLLGVDRCEHRRE
jgi:hypothetical protein